MPGGVPYSRCSSAVEASNVAGTVASTRAIQVTPQLVRSAAVVDTSPRAPSWLRQSCSEKPLI